MASKPITIQGLELVLSHTEKLCIGSYYRQFSTNIKIKLIKSIPVLLARAFGPSGQSGIATFNVFGYETALAKIRTHSLEERPADVHGWKELKE